MPLSHWKKGRKPKGRSPRARNQAALSRFWIPILAREREVGIHPKYRNRRSEQTPAIIAQYENKLTDYRHRLTPPKAKARRRA